jgi:uncharacterized protein (DUF488 family)
MGQRTLFTVGHSTRTWAEFVALLKAWGIEELVDVRTVPQSRKFPWFSKKLMEKSLPKSAIEYVHLPKLGGFRHSTRASANTGWQNSRFRGYADYMQTKEFEDGLAELNRRRKKWRVCVMCSEAVWWRCHRRMIADAEVTRGIPVKHVMSEKAATRHEVTEFAVVEKRRGGTPMITYPTKV